MDKRTSAVVFLFILPLIGGHFGGRIMLEYNPIVGVVFILTVVGICVWCNQKFK